MKSELHFGVHPEYQIIMRLVQ